MSESKVITRDQIDNKYKWDLTTMYKDDQAQEVAYEEVEKSFERLAAYQGSLADSADQLAKALDDLLEVERQLENVYVYAHLKHDQDSNVGRYQTMEAKAAQLYAQYSQAVSFFLPEVVAIPKEQLEEFIASNPRLKEYEHYLDDMTRGRDHVLSKDKELLLAQASEALDASSNTFSFLNNADFEFPEVKDQDGKSVQLTHGLYGKFLESSDRRLRQDTFEAFYSVYNQFKNTLASTLSGVVKKNNFLAKAHKFDSARQAALFRNAVPEAVYDTLLETVNGRLDLLHRYTALRKDVLNLDSLEVYDTYTPLSGEPPLTFSYEEAQEIVLEALKPMGEDYLEIVHKAFDEGWIDVYENKGKRSGGYSSGTYDSNPYILLNWQDNISSMYTLIHEIGHSAHSYLTHNNQPYMYGGYPIFLAEIASTMNENLLTSYLLDKYADNRDVKLFVLNHFLDGVKGTVFRQTQFAEFEHFIYQADAQGQPLTADFLTDNYRELNKKYYGSALNSDSQVALEWSRIPHFYYNYYVFQYATGLSAATAFADKVVEGDQELLASYKGFLKSGDHKYPVETMKDAGLDMTQATFINDTLDLFERRLDEFESLINSSK